MAPNRAFSKLGSMWEVPFFYLFIVLSVYNRLMSSYLYLPILFICSHLPILFSSTVTGNLYSNGQT